MYLFMDEYGNVYQGSVDRADAHGVETLPAVVDHYGDQTIQNPYIIDEAKRASEKAATTKLNIAQAAASKAQADKAARDSASVTTLDSKMQQYLSKEAQIEEALSQTMQGYADFDREAIVDGDYGAKHQACLYNMGYIPEATDIKFDASIYPVDVSESESQSLRLQAADYLDKRQVFDTYYENKSEVQAPVPSIVDAQAQQILSASEDMYFDSEAEAQAYQSANAPTQSVIALATTASLAKPPANKLVVAAASIIAAILVFGGK